MSGFVVDASVAVKWLIDEPLSAQAAKLVDDELALAAPELIYAEAANALWAIARRGNIDADDVREALDLLADAPLTGVLYIGKAQERARGVRTERRRNARTGASYPWIVACTAMVSHVYFYCVDEDFGPFFLKFCTYFPYNAKRCLNEPPPPSMATPPSAAQ
jgi:hypothetical protein